jgi:hypothetical protein
MYILECNREQLAVAEHEASCTRDSYLHSAPLRSLLNRGMLLTAWLYFPRAQNNFSKMPCQIKSKIKARSSIE